MVGEVILYLLLGLLLLATLAWFSSLEEYTSAPTNLVILFFWPLVLGCLLFYWLGLVLQWLTQPPQGGGDAH